MQFNCIIIGDEAVGKTTYITRFTSGEFISDYHPTVHPVITNLRLKTNKGVINFNIFENFGPQHVDCAIIMFDVNSPDFLPNLLTYHRYLLKTYGNIPFVIAGNKCDKVNVNHNCKRISRLLIDNGNLHKNYYTISAKSNYNFDKPFLFLCEKLLNDGPITHENLDQDDFDFYNILPLPIITLPIKAS